MTVLSKDKKTQTTQTLWKVQPDFKASRLHKDGAVMPAMVLLEAKRDDVAVPQKGVRTDMYECMCLQCV